MTRRLSIMHVISAPAAGGAEVYVKDLALAMAKAGHRVSIVFLNHAADVGRAPEYESQFLGKLEAGGVEVDFIGHEARRNPVFGWRRLRSIVRQRAPDVLHCHLFYGVLFAAFAAVPVVYTHHSIELRLPRHFYKAVLDRIVHTYVGICGACTKVLQDASAKPVVRIDNGVDPARIVQRVDGEETQDVRLMAVGRLTDQKNYGLLLDALSSLGDLRWSLAIAGEGPSRHELERKVVDLGLAHRVTLLGNVSNVAERIAEADIFVMSSAWEGLPIALIEATLSGQPVVVTNVGGCAEVVHEVANGLVVEPGDVRGLAAALRRVLESDSQRAFFSGNAIAYSARYRLETAVGGHEQLYRALGGSNAG